MSFTAGATLGATGSTAASKSAAPGVILSSDKHSVIVCEADNARQCSFMHMPGNAVPQDICLRYRIVRECARTGAIHHERWHLEDLARISGFTTIVSRSIFIQDGKQYHVPEVK